MTLTFQSMNYYVTIKEQGEPARIWLVCPTRSSAEAEAAYRRRCLPQHEWGVFHSLKIAEISQGRLAR